MIFSDPLYVFGFLPLAVAAFYLCVRLGGVTGGHLALTAASVAFYSLWNWYYTAIFLGSIVVNYGCASALSRMDRSRVKARRSLMTACLVFDFFLLFWFKYKVVIPAIFTDDYVGITSLFSIAIPIGISFYTFQQAVFMLDAYNKADGIEDFLGSAGRRAERLRGLLRYVMFVSFFPQLVIGPIVYLREFRAEISRRDFGRLRRVNIEVGATLLIIGLFKKLVIADNLAPFTDQSFLAVGTGATESSLVALCGSLAYFAQLYFDFSGYSDMAVGSARLFGIRLPINFLSPLKSTGIVDFYRRWHITLTRVISRFVYTPISLMATRRAMAGGMKPPMRRMAVLWVPLWLNFLIIALWHGAAMTFVVFGLIHGTWYILELEVTSSKRWKKRVATIPPLVREIAGRVYFFVPMMLCFSLFRAESLDQFQALVSAMASFDLAWPQGFPLKRAAVWIAGAFAVILLAPNSVDLLRRYRPGYITWRVAPRIPRLLDRVWRPNMVWALYVTGLFLVCVYYMNRQAPFLYLGF